MTYCNLNKNAKIYVGCGNDKKEGYIGCDIRQTENCEVVCKAWEVSKNFIDAKEIYSRHMLEHLTFSQLELTLTDWHKCLQSGGSIHLIVPNIDYHIEQWKKAKWDEENWKEQWSDARWSAAGFWGWQNECAVEDTSNINETTFWDVHKSGHNIKSITFFLSRAGFSDIKCEIIDNVHLCAKAIKI